jgi:hypothetical protein
VREQQLAVAPQLRRLGQELLRRLALLCFTALVSVRRYDRERVGTDERSCGSDWLPPQAPDY